MRHEHKEQNWLITISLVILAVVALAVALIYTRTVMIPFVVALFIVALVSPIEDFQVKRLRLPRVVAIIVTLLVVLSVIALVSLFVAQAIRTIAYTAREYSTSFDNMANKLLEAAGVPVQTGGAAASRWRRRRRSRQPPAAPNNVEPVQSKPEAIELFPVVKDADKPAILDVRPQPSPPTRPGQGSSIMLHAVPEPESSAGFRDATKEADKPAVPAGTCSAAKARRRQDSNEAVGRHRQRRTSRRRASGTSIPGRSSRT